MGEGRHEAAHADDAAGRTAAPRRGTYDTLSAWLETEIDRFADARPNPGRTEAFHRLNRAEYANAIRDLLSLDIDVAELLPADDIDEYGFDNMADVLTVSPALMERYLSTARKIGRLAVGETPLGPATETYKVPILLLQDDRMSDDAPFGSRGASASATTSRSTGSTTWRSGSTATT